VLADAWLLAQIKEIHWANRGVYGAHAFMPSPGSLAVSVWAASASNGSWPRPGSPG
jgi:hypothetical protein